MRGTLLFKLADNDEVAGDDEVASISSYKKHAKPAYKALNFSTPANRPSNTP